MDRRGFFLAVIKWVCVDYQLFRSDRDVVELSDPSCLPRSSIFFGGYIGWDGNDFHSGKSLVGLKRLRRGLIK
jgi:hypothetical protein